MLRTIARVVLLAGAAMSLMLMFRGRHAPLVLIVLFTGWVLSPFLALAFASGASTRFRPSVQAAVDCVTLALSTASVAAYAGWIPMPSGSRPAFVFLMVPAVSWVAMIALALALWRADRTPGAGS
jgi:hypothetical protein